MTHALLVIPQDTTRGHLVTCCGGVEFFALGDDVFRARQSSPLDVNGYRMGARWEAPRWWWDAHGATIVGALGGATCLADAR